MKKLNIKYSKNNSNYIDILNHLQRSNHLFKPVLSSYINLDEYSLKLYERSTRFEIFNDTYLIGLLAIYNRFNECFISNFSLEESFIGHGLSNHLMLNFLEDSKIKKVKSISLEVFKINQRAVNFYNKHGFKIDQENNEKYTLVKIL